MIPKAGGDYEYIMAAFGNVMGFLFVWAQLVIVIPASNAVAAGTFADYALQLVYHNCHVPFWPRYLLASSAVRKFALLSFFYRNYCE